jgi:hypothetical protein
MNMHIAKRYVYLDRNLINGNVYVGQMNCNAGHLQSQC